MGYDTLEDAAAALPDDDVESERFLDVGTLTQFGPSCGFYSLYLVMDYWYRQGQAQQPLPPRFRHVVDAPPPTPNVQLALRGAKKPNDGSMHSLRQVGKTIGVTTQGTVLSTENLGRVALRLGDYVFDNPQATTEEAFLRLCILSIEGGLPIIVGIDANTTREQAGKPYVRVGATAENPNRAGHWAVVHGVRQYDGAPPIFIASHWGKYWIWTAAELSGSNLGLRWYPREVFRKRTARRRAVTTVSMGDTVYHPGSNYYLDDWTVATAPFEGARRIVPLSDISGMRGRVLVVRPQGVMGLVNARDHVLTPLPGAIWQPDSTTSHCRGCGTGFGLFTRKHHCRACGHIFCSNCSSHTRNVRNRLSSTGRRDGTATVRVCDRCHAAEV